MSLRRTSFLVAILAVGAGALAACSAGSSGGGTEVKLTEADTGKPVELSVGQSLVVSLKSNPTTGYEWTAAQNGAPQLAMQGDKPGYTPDAASAGMAGGGGTSVFTFKAAQPGSTALTLNYARSFEPNNPPGQTFSVPVTVK